MKIEGGDITPTSMNTDLSVDLFRGSKAGDMRENGKSRCASEPGRRPRPAGKLTAAEPLESLRLFVDKMGSVPLLTREGEVEICKRIEQGEEEILSALIESPIAIRQVADLGSLLESGRICVKRLTLTFDPSPWINGAVARATRGAGKRNLL